MKPISFEQQNVVFAKDQKEYQPLPAYKSDFSDGRVTTCWRLSIRDRLKLLLSGRVWLEQLTFNNPLQPQRISVDSPFINKNA